MELSAERHRAATVRERRWRGACPLPHGRGSASGAPTPRSILKEEGGHRAKAVMAATRYIVSASTRSKASRESPRG
jgi:hypothetical protein